MPSFTSAGTAGKRRGGRDDSETLAAQLIAEHGDPDPADPTFRFGGGDWFSPRFDTARHENDESAAGGG